MTNHSTRPIAAILGAGVTGGRVAKFLANDVRIAVHDPIEEHAANVAHFLDGVIIDKDHAAVADVAVLAFPAPHAPTARRLLEAGVAVVSLSDNVDDVRNLLALDSTAANHGTQLVIGAAMSPGLSGLMARMLATRMAEVDEIHVALHGTGGPDCARQHHAALGGTSLGWHDGEWVERPAGAGRELCWFPAPVNSYDCYRAEMPDPLLLQRVFPTAQRISARMSANRRDRLTSRLPMLAPPHREGGIGATRVEVRGALANGERATAVAAVAIRSATGAAAVAATMARWALAKPSITGAILTGDERLDTMTLLHEISRCGVKFHEFVGQPAVIPAELPA